jgi:hypothetical protein
MGTSLACIWSSVHDFDKDCRLFGELLLESSVLTIMTIMRLVPCYAKCQSRCPLDLSAQTAWTLAGALHPTQDLVAIAQLIGADDVGVLGLHEAKIPCVEDISCWCRDAGALAADNEYCRQAIPREDLGCLCLACYYAVCDCVQGAAKVHA